MMKWNVKAGATNIGAMDLGNLTYDENQMLICLDILNVSDELQAEIDKVIELEKVRFLEKRQELVAECIELGKEIHPANLNLVWSDEPVVMDFVYLSIFLEAGKPATYYLNFGFHDALNDFMEAWDGYIEIDLSAYVEELKEAVAKMVIDKFF